MMSDILVYLDEWLKGKRDSWTKYGDYLKKYNESHDLLDEIPSVESFINAIMGILKNTANSHQLNKSVLEKIFSQKSARSWESGRTGEERISSGMEDYIEILKQQAGISANEADAVREYLTDLNDKILKLLGVPFSIKFGLNYKILNGNKYVKLLTLLDQIKRDDREELKRYQNFTDSDLKSDATLYENRIRFYGLTSPILELYCIVNLHRDSVYIYNSRIVLKKFGYGYKDPNTFKDLFDFFPIYDRFVSEKYTSFVIDTRQNLRTMLHPSLNDDQKSVLLRHVEVDQFFSSYQEKESEENIPPNESSPGNPNNGHVPELCAYARIPRNMILHGPVGTGKTYLAGKLANYIAMGKIKELAEVEKLLNGNFKIEEREISAIEDGSIRIVTFHQSYGYEEFIGGIRASTENNTIKYGVEDGIFMKMCNEARDKMERPYVIIIDEINRGDISRVFGELITLIEEDKRYMNNDNPGLSLTIPNFRDKFSVPDNVFIIGTMNDSDRSIALLDVALRRRFTFFNIPPNKDVLKSWISEESGIRELVSKSFEGMNRKITEVKGEDSQIGHAFFKSLKGLTAADETKQELLRIFKYKILPLLRELFYGQDDTLSKKILSRNFLEKDQVSSAYRLNEDELDAKNLDLFISTFEKLSD